MVRRSPGSPRWLTWPTQSTRTQNDRPASFAFGIKEIASAAASRFTSLFLAAHPKRVIIAKYMARLFVRIVVVSHCGRLSLWSFLKVIALFLEVGALTRAKILNRI
jgi:hypothetical protein